MHDTDVEAQTLEAVGTLAAGVAHEYNNLLMAIAGFSELLLGRLEPGSAERRYVDEIRTATDRAASLTHQLLAFGRKQMLAPRLLSVNDIVAVMAPALRRRLGAAVELVTRLDPKSGRVEADPLQLEEVISQLAVNAREAMPGGGTLTIESTDADSGADRGPGAADGESSAWVILRVRDTGLGMDPETQARLFEPFFTPKEAGSGTGLGLATVHGFVKQSAGLRHHVPNLSPARRRRGARGGGASDRRCPPPRWRNCAYRGG